MKTATLPSLRVDAGLRMDAESVLRQGETLSSFIGLAVRDAIRSRQMKTEFIARGLASGDRARPAGEYFSADDVVHELEDMLAAARPIPTMPFFGTWSLLSTRPAMSPCSR